MNTPILDGGLPGLGFDEGCPLGHTCSKCQWFRQVPLDMSHPLKPGVVISQGTWGCNLNWNQLTQIEIARQVISLNGNISVLAVRMEQIQQEAQLTQEKLIAIFDKLLQMATTPSAPPSSSLYSQIESTKESH